MRVSVEWVLILNSNPRFSRLRAITLQRAGTSFPLVLSGANVLLRMTFYTNPFIREEGQVDGLSTLLFPAIFKQPCINRDNPVGDSPELL